MSRAEKTQEIASYRKINTEFAPWFIQQHKEVAPGCPFHAALGEKRAATYPPKEFDISRDVVKTD